MVNPRAVRDNLKEWLKNPTWAKYYNGAKTELLREYIALDFYASETENEEAFEKMDRLLMDMNKAEVQYLYENCIGPEKAKYHKLLERMN